MLLPIIALIPDLTLLLMQKIFFPTPTDAVMRLQQKNPNFVYQGFKDVFVPGLPDEDELKRREQENKQAINTLRDTINQPAKQSSNSQSLRVESLLDADSNAQNTIM